MGQISLNREDVERVLANPESDPSTRLISAAALALFEAKVSAESASREAMTIALKLAHMLAREIYDAQEAAVAAEVDG
jgi:hypothetical protein